MTHPTPTPEPPAPRDPADPGTREIEVGTTVTATGTHQLPRVDADPLPSGVQATGPVDSLPGPPRTGTPPPPPPPPPPPTPPGAIPGPGTPEAPTSADVLGLSMAAPEAPRPARTPRSPQERTVLAGTGLTALSQVLLQVGLTLSFGDAPLWSTVTLWSLFATLAALLGLLPFAGRFVPAARPGDDAAWRVAAGGLTGVAVFWVLVVLPRVDSDRGFVLTAALAALGAALWVAPGRSRG
ncbi:hypothetical protein E4P41_18390 [Geodermatophilus sp. DF01-2]|uniref:hypothetical protein n=1 Tax=Geodermatophilus sp. DF01-2 TaxID=2559610 RepID=UPI0010737126|nr:hypothetical protein [Geodermatophilus sp. DF01_2]TFV54735.1 hypothetical protein E4P41_18390 [Geodermatophilus sp. DF01_2]